MGDSRGGFFAGLRVHPELGIQVQALLGFLYLLPSILTSTSIAERLQKGFPLPLPTHVQLLNLLLQSHQVSSKGPFSPNLPPQQQPGAESFLYASLVSSAFYPCNNRERWGLSVNREGRLRLRNTTQLLKPRSKARFLLLTVGYVIPT